MSTADFVIRQNDTLPRLTASILDGNGDPVDISGATVALHLHGLDVEREIDRPALIVDADNGQVGYDWDVDDTTDPGFFGAEFQVTLGNGQVQTFPNDGVFLVQVYQQVA